MAEALLVGPLLNLGIYLAQWVLRKRNAKIQDKEHIHESIELTNSVELLAHFLQQRAHFIRQFQRDLEIQSGSLGNTFLTLSDLIESLSDEIHKAHVEAIIALDDKKLNASNKRLRIQGLHDRLTQCFVFHLGFLMMEVRPSELGD